MPLHNRSYRTQVFFFSLLLALVPVLSCMAIVTVNSTNEFSRKYQDTFNSIAVQTNLSIDQALSAPIRLSALPLINDDVLRAMNTNYESYGSSSKFALDSTLIRAQIAQANLLNTDISEAVFVNRYGYAFEYGNVEITTKLTHIEEWAQAARDNGLRTWVAPIQKTGEGASARYVLPIVRLMWDVTTNQELGVMGVITNFDIVDKILKASALWGSQILLLDRDNRLYYSTDEAFFAEGANAALLESLREAGAQITPENTELVTTVRAGGDEYMVCVIYNKTAGWKIVHFMDKSFLFRESLRDLVWIFPVFFILAACCLLLSNLVSRRLSQNVQLLVEEIDHCENSTGCMIQPRKNASYEFIRIIDSYNRLTKRLVRSMEEMYNSQLNEKQTRLQMLQAQINPHFLYNTLNLMASLANIYDAPEIRTVAIKMAELLRYNLKSGPVVTLKEEVDQVERYFAIQAIRFPGKYAMECALPDELRQMQVPAFILQPIVENAVLHGLSERERDGYVMINCFVEFEKLHILVADNGVGISPEKLARLAASLEKPAQEAHSSIGLTNVNQRIQAYCGSGYGLRLNSTQGKGTMVELTLPLSEKLSQGQPFCC